MPSLKGKLNDQTRLAGVLCTIPSAVVTQAMAASGLDFVVLDMEHGAIDIAAAHAMIAATAGTACAPLVRIPELGDVHVKRALDMGAEGIVFPLIRSTEDAAAAIASMRYPPEGTRGFGPFLAQSRWQTSLPEYPGAVAPSLVSILTIETAEAVENIEAICALNGVDVIVPAPFDLSTELGVMGQFDHPKLVAAMARVEQAAQAAKIPLMNLARDRDGAKALFDRGYCGIVHFDVLWLREKASEFRGWAQE